MCHKEADVPTPQDGVSVPRGVTPTSEDATTVPTAMVTLREITAETVRRICALEEIDEGKRVMRLALEPA